MNDIVSFLEKVDTLSTSEASLLLFCFLCTFFLLQECLRIPEKIIRLLLPQKEIQEKFNPLESLLGQQELIMDRLGDAGELSEDERWLQDHIAVQIRLLLPQYRSAEKEVTTPPESPPASGARSVLL